MAISMVRVSMPVFVRMRTNLAGKVEKAATHAEARRIDPAVLAAPGSECDRQNLGIGNSVFPGNA